MDNAQRFLTSFSSIEKSLKQITRNPRYTKFYQMLEEARHKNRIVQKYEIELQEFSELRNAIVHQRDGVGKIIAQPTDETVEIIEKIAELLSDVHPISKYFLKQVLTCHPDDVILDVHNKMRESHISKIPVYDNRQYCGILTVENIACWACDEMIHQTSKQFVKNILDETSENERVFFMSKHESVNEVYHIFNTSMKKGKSVLAIVITEDGVKHQRPIGIVTVKDLPRILEYF